MHFSIPDTQVNKNVTGSYVTFNIYINGSFHCSLRYRQLYDFHLQLKKSFGTHSLHNFPPKKLFPLTPGQLEERRSQLEKYVQIASQDSQIVNSDIFNGFLLNAQQETHSEVKPSEIYFDIYQLNWQCCKVLVKTGENSQSVLRKYAQAIHLNKEYLSYFSLYLVRRFENDFKTIRRLQNFESPYLTLYTENKKLSFLSSPNSNGSGVSYFIIVRKSYWDSAYDRDLFGDKAALNIIYLQALHEVEKGYVIANKETRNQLTSLQAKGDKIEYLNVARTLKYYSYINFDPCYCDYPSPKTCIKVSAGNQELNIRILNSNEQYSFPVVRIKCWRLTTSNNQQQDENDLINGTQSNLGDRDQVPSIKGRFELSFEYLINKGLLKWITIYSSQAVLMSTCLQSMVEEMLIKREGKKFRSEGFSLRYNTSPNYSNLATTTGNTTKPNGTNNGLIGDQNGSHHPLNDESRTPSTSSLNKPMNEHNNRQSDNVSKSSSLNSDSHQHQHHSSDDPFYSNGLSDIKPIKYSRLMKNNVFDEIGDDDL